MQSNVWLMEVRRTNEKGVARKPPLFAYRSTRPTPAITSACRYRPEPQAAFRPMLESGSGFQA